MSMKILRYLNPSTGEYSDDVTLKSVGDLNDLLTAEKETIVGAINSLVGGNYDHSGNAVISPEVIKKITEVSQKIDNLFIEPMTTEQLEAFRNMLDEGLDAKVSEKVQVLTEEQIRTYNANLEKAKETLGRSILSLNIEKENVKQDVEKVRESLLIAKTQLEKVQEDYVNINEIVDSLEGVLTQKVDYAFFDLMNASMTEGSTTFEQSKKAVELIAKEKRLDFSDEHVIDSIARLRLLSGLIETRVSHSEMQEEIEKIETIGHNLLRRTRDFEDLWTPSNGNVLVLNEEFRNAKILKVDNTNGYMTYDLEGLEQGASYTVSVIAKLENEDGSGRISFFYGADVFELLNDNEDSILGTEFQRYFTSFVGKEGVNRISFRFSGIANNHGYMVAPKIEKGKVARDWQPHVDDDFLSIRSAESAIKQTANEVVLVANLLEQNGENISTSNAHIRNAADRIKLQSEKLETAAEDASYAKGQVEILSDKISLKVESSDIDKAISEITLDSKNRVLNSNFSLPDFKGWLSHDNNFVYKEIDNKKYAYVNTPTTQDQITLTSNYFPVKNLEKLVFGLDIITDNHTALINPIVSIQLFNENNIRVMFKEFRLNELQGGIPVNNKPFRVYGSYLIDREDVVKATIRVHLKNNRNTGFTDFIVSSGDFKKVLWNASPGDNELLVAEKFAEIKVEAGQVALKAVESRIDEAGTQLDLARAELEVASNGIRQFVVDAHGNKQGLDLSQEGLYIDFDKVKVDGDMLARRITTGALDISQGLRITNGNIDVLRAGADGQIEMNVSKLNINSLPVATEESVNRRVSGLATKEQLENIKLTPGPRGVSIQSVKNYYLATNQANGVTRSTSGWSTDVASQQISSSKQYLWNYEQTMFDDGTTNNTQPMIIGYWGRDGVSGTSGRGIKTITEYYLLNNVISGITHSTSGWTTTTQVPTQANRYVWNYEKVEYTDGSTPTLTTPRIIAMFGEKGERGQQGIQGQKGQDGRDGIGINTVTNYYKLTNSTTIPSHTDSGWVTTPPTTSPTNRYLWNYEKITYTSGEPTSTPVAMIGVHGVDGARGANGSDGRSITSVDEYYLASGASSGITRSTTGWTTTVQKPTDAKPYLWNYEKINFSSGNPSYTEPILIGYKARDGRNGTDGVAGRDGVGIRSTEITYGLSTSDTTQPTTWTTQVPTLVKGQYLWTKTVWTYTNSTTETGYVKTYIAQDGNNGVNGVAGKDGVGIKNTTITYAASTNGTIQPTNGWQAQVPNVPNGQYLWTKTVWTYTDNTNEAGYSVARMGNDGEKGERGEKGDTGVATRNYILDSARHKDIYDIVVDQIAGTFTIVLRTNSSVPKIEVWGLNR